MKKLFVVLVLVVTVSGLSFSDEREPASHAEAWSSFSLVLKYGMVSGCMAGLNAAEYACGETNIISYITQAFEAVGPKYIVSFLDQFYQEPSNAEVPYWRAITDLLAAVVKANMAGAPSSD